MLNSTGEHWARFPPVPHLSSQHGDSAEQICGLVREVARNENILVSQTPWKTVASNPPSAQAAPGTKQERDRERETMRETDWSIDL